MLLERLESLLGVVLTGLLAFSLVSVPMAMLDFFRPAPVVAGSLFIWIVAWTVWKRGRDNPTFGRRSGPTIAVVVVVLGLTALNVRYSSQHLLTDRDPGVYVTTARWLANEGTLLVEPEAYAYRGVINEHRIRYAAAGYYEGHRDDGKLYPQFVHLLPATLGASSWIVGARGMLKVNALLGGLALLMFFVFATKLLRPWPAAGATIALGLSLVQVHFSRDAYTEVLTQMLLFGGLWALLSARQTLHPGRAAIAGLLVGAASMARLDAFIFLVPLAIYIAYDVVSFHATPAEPRHRRYLVALGVGAAVPALIAFLDARLFSPLYLADLWGSVRVVWAVLVVIALATAVVVFAQSRFVQWAEWGRCNRETLGIVAAGGIVAAAVVLYFLRPHVQTAMQDHVNRFVEHLQRREGLPVNGRRTYAEDSLGWLSLYLGPAALWSGVVGIALMTREVVLGRATRAIPFTFAFLPMFALYVWNPSITPDHIWALRRFLPVVIPGLILGCFWLLGRLWWTSRSRAAARVATVVIAGLALAFPAWTLAPVVTARSYLGVLSVTERFCSSLPEDAAVLVAQTQLLDQNFTQTVRTFCSLPAATAPMDQPLDWYRELARRWARHGRVLYVVSPQSWFGTHWPAEGATYIAATTYSNLERSLTGRPDSFETFSWGLFVRRADLGSAG